MEIKLNLPSLLPFGYTRDWTQGLREALSHLNHSSSTFAFNIFGFFRFGSSTFAWAAFGPGSSYLCLPGSWDYRNSFFNDCKNDYSSKPRTRMNKWWRDSPLVSLTYIWSIPWSPGWDILCDHATELPPNTQPTCHRPSGRNLILGGANFNLCFLKHAWRKTVVESCSIILSSLSDKTYS
jgi:hypothetical protein